MTQENLFIALTVSKTINKQLKENNNGELFFITDNYNVAQIVKDNYDGNLGIYLKPLFDELIEYPLWSVHTTNGSRSNANITSIKFIENPKQYKKTMKETMKKFKEVMN